MGSFSDLLEDWLLDHLFMQSAYTPPAVLALILCTDSIDDTSLSLACNEHPSQDGYARVGTTFDTWNAASVGVITNTQAITFPQATADWTVITHFAFCDDVGYGLGNLLMWGEFDTPITVLNTEVLSFAEDQFIIGLD
jgi:hypothetical protein